MNEEQDDSALIEQLLALGSSDVSEAIAAIPPDVRLEIARTLINTMPTTPHHPTEK